MKQTTRRAKEEPRTSEYSRVAFEILGYLSEHPEAEDTVEGIVHWWMLEQKIKRLSAEVRSALGELVSEGFVLERRGPDGLIHYSVNPSKVKEIGALLRRMARKKDEDKRS